MKTGTDTAVQEQPGPVASLLEGFLDEKDLNELNDIGKGAAPAKHEPKKQVAQAKNEAADPEEEEQESEEEADEKSEAKKTDKKADKQDVKSKKDKDPEEEEEEESEEEEEELPEQKNKFGIRVGGKKDDKKASKLNIKSFDELPSVLKSKYGQDIKDVKALPKFLETVDKWRSDSQNLDKVSKEKDNAIAVFENLPPELLNAVKLHYNGQDFRNAFDSNIKLDFSKSVDKHEPKNLVNAFYPGEFTDDDFESDEPSRELKIAIKASEKEYNLEKQTREQRAKNQVDQAERKSKAYTASVKSSVSALKSAFPEMAQDVQADVEHTLSSGALMSEFFNPDGTYKPTAAKALMLARHGEELIEELMKIAELRGESNANEEMVKRSPSKPKQKNGASKDPAEGKEVTDRIDKLLPKELFNKRTF